ncbi:MAG: glycerol acyltransferase [Actinobacteria bacterium]|nr:glycerol acyltransferase [Actinomycetota bacterium]
MGEAEIIRMSDRASRAEEGDRCKATTSSGRPCRNTAVPGSPYCRLHAPDDAPDPSGKAGSPIDAARDMAGDAVSGFGAFLQRRFRGDYEVDDFGYDRELSRNVLLPLGRPLYENYFRIRTLGITRIPSEGPALLVANHSGTVALDAVMMSYAVAHEHPSERVVRSVAADLVFTLPVLGPMARKAGNVVACDEDALELLRRGELVGVFPEGYKGVGKGWHERYRLQRFGRGGFIETALRARVPIIPVSIVGAEEAYPMIGDARFIARAFGFPYFPITPTFPWLGPLGLVPFPSKWVIEFGEPIPMDGYPEDAAEDPMLVFDLSDSIRDTIQQMLYRNLKIRGSAFI